MTAKSKLPPVPPASRTPFGERSDEVPGEGATHGAAQDAEGGISAREAEANMSSRDRNLGEQGRQGNIRQNTFRQGDRKSDS
jgi:hypothetical protein